MREPVSIRFRRVHPYWSTGGDPRRAGLTITGVKLSCVAFREPRRGSRTSLASSVGEVLHPRAAGNTVGGPIRTGAQLPELARTSASHSHANIVRDQTNVNANNSKDRKWKAKGEVRGQRRTEEEGGRRKAGGGRREAEGGRREAEETRTRKDRREVRSWFWHAGDRPAERDARPNDVLCANSVVVGTHLGATLAPPSPPSHAGYRP